RRAGPDHSHALARKVGVAMRPSGGVVPFALEVIEPRNIGEMMGGQDADRGDEKTRARPPSVRRCDLPSIPALVEARGNDPGVELDVLAQIELVGDVVQVALGFGLPREMLLPVPFPKQLIRERISVRVALRIESCARITVPIPGAANSSTFLVDVNREAHLAEPVQLEQTGNAGADDDRVEPLNSRLPRAGGLPFNHDCTPLSRRIAPGTLPG